MVKLIITTLLLCVGNVYGENLIQEEPKPMKYYERTIKLDLAVLSQCENSWSKYSWTTNDASGGGASCSFSLFEFQNTSFATENLVFYLELNYRNVLHEVHLQYYSNSFLLDTKSHRDEELTYDNTKELLLTALKTLPNLELKTLVLDSISYAGHPNIIKETDLGEAVLVKRQLIYNDELFNLCKSKWNTDPFWRPHNSCTVLTASPLAFKTTIKPLYIQKEFKVDGEKFLFILKWDNNFKISIFRENHRDKRPLPEPPVIWPYVEKMIKEAVSESPLYVHLFVPRTEAAQSDEVTGVPSTVKVIKTIGFDDFKNGLDYEATSSGSFLYGQYELPLTFEPYTGLNLEHTVYDEFKSGDQIIGLEVNTLWNSVTFKMGTMPVRSKDEMASMFTTHMNKYIKNPLTFYFMMIDIIQKD